MKISLVSLVALAMAANAAGQGTVKLLPAPIELPARLGPLVYNEKPNKYDDPRLGVAYGYNAQGALLTIYVYDAGITDIPDGADTMPTCQEFEVAKQGVRETPSYKNTVLKSEQLVRLGPPEDAPLAREAVFEMEREGRQAISYVWITGAEKHFVKLRFTMFAPHTDEIAEARRTVLNALGAAIRPHLAPVDPKEKDAGSSLTLAINDSGANDMGIGIGYLLLLSEIAEKNPVNAPVCGGEYVPTFEEDVAAYQGALTIMEESGDGSRFAKKLAAANKAGMFEEFIWSELHREQWGTTPPDGLDLAAYAPWRKKNVKKLLAPAFGGITIDHPRPLPVESAP
jgi:hypothetical protein